MILMKMGFAGMSEVPLAPWNCSFSLTRLTKCTDLIKCVFWKEWCSLAICPEISRLLNCSMVSSAVHLTAATLPLFNVRDSGPSGVCVRYVWERLKQHLCCRCWRPENKCVLCRGWGVSSEHTVRLLASERHFLNALPSQSVQISTGQKVPVRWVQRERGLSSGKA